MKNCGICFVVLSNLNNSHNVKKCKIKSKIPAQTHTYLLIACWFISPQMMIFSNLQMLLPDGNLLLSTIKYFHIFASDNKF